MKSLRPSVRYFVLGLLGTFAMGCANLELASTPTTVVPLSGVWLVDNTSSDDIAEAMRPDKRLLSKNRLSTRSEIERIRRGSGLAIVADGFQVLEANRIEIELGDDSMGVQHLPGVYRDVSWGLKDRGIWRVQAGWEEDALVIASKTSGIDVLERYQLVNENRLVVRLDIKADGNKRSILRAFRRLQ